MGSLPWLHHESAVNGGRAGHTVGSLGIWVPRSGSDGRSVWSSAEVIDVWDWLEADGEVEARSILEDLDDDSEDRVSLCWGAIPWLKDLSPAAWEVCEEVGWGGGQAFVQVETERGVREVLMIAPSSRAHLQGSWLCVQSRQDCCVGDLVAAWMESFESVIEEEGWSIDGDDGDGSQGWLIRQGSLAEAWEVAVNGGDLLTQEQAEAIVEEGWASWSDLTEVEGKGWRAH